MVMNNKKKFIARIQQIHRQVQEQLHKAQQCYKEQHERHRTTHQFKVGDMVWLHLSKETLKGEGRKIKPICYGPFQIVQQIGDNAFKLDLPMYMTICSVVKV